MKDAQVIKYALDRIGGRWKSMIVWELKYGPKRFSDLKADIVGITQKMLTSSLVELQADGLLVRKSFPQIPPRVEYTLTSLGESMVPITAALFEWGALNQGMEVPQTSWQKPEVEITTTPLEGEAPRQNVADTEEVMEVQKEEVVLAERESHETITEKVTEETVENDPWFFAPMPQKNVAKKKSNKKSSGNDPGTQQLGLF
jgi:DNA-binding HxlR family transcriptional regulator